MTDPMMVLSGLLLLSAFAAVGFYSRRQQKAGRCLGCDSMPSSGCAACPCRRACQGTARAGQAAQQCCRDIRRDYPAGKPANTRAQ